MIVEATDTSSNKATLAVTITIIDVDEIAPVLTGSESVSLAEGTTTVATSNAHERVHWGLSGTDHAALQISSAGGLTFKVAPDYETKNSYSVIVEATDNNGNKGTKAVSITITDVDEVAPVITGSESVSIAEGTTAVATYNANETVTWSLSGTDEAALQISSAGGLTFKVAPDYETKNSYSVIVEATDSNGNKGTKAVSITITDVDEIAPVITGPTDGTVSVLEGLLRFIRLVQMSLLHGVSLVQR